jgi:hypothetical protein
LPSDRRSSRPSLRTISLRRCTGPRPRLLGAVSGGTRTILLLGSRSHVQVLRMASEKPR